MTTRCPRIVAVCLALSLWACAGRAVPPRPTPRTAVCSSALPVPPRVAATTAGQPRNALVRPLIAAVTSGTTRELLVYDLRVQTMLWRKPVPATARPQILGDVLVTTVAGAMVGFDLATGRERWRVPLDRPRWFGAAQTGSQVLFTSSADGDDTSQRSATLTAIDAARGTLLWRRAFTHAIARPSCRERICYLLSEHRDLLALRSDTGVEAGCAHLESGDAEWVDAGPEGLFYGAQDAHLVGVDASSGVLSASTVPVPHAELAGQAGPYPSSYLEVPAQRSAHGRIALALRLSAAPPDGSVPRTDRYASIFYRAVFGHQSDGTLAWARMLQQDVVRSQATGQGLLVVSDDGLVRLLDWQTGQELRRAALGMSIESADLDAEALMPDSKPTDARPLRSALFEIALDPDARLLPARLLAVDALAELALGEATRDLLDIYGQTATPQAMRERVAARLLTRRQGTEHLVDALLAHRDFLDDTPAPALFAIVPALVAQRQTRAVPLLLDQLFSPDTPVSELPGLVSALTQLGDATVQPELARFLRLYHADSSLGADPRALVAAASAVFQRGDSNDRALVARLGDSPRTLPALRTSLLALVSSGSAEPSVQQASGSAPAVNAEALPQALSDAAIRHTFAEHAEELRRCMLQELAERPETRTVRLSFVADHQGKASAIHVTPDRPALGACLRASLGSYDFPHFRSGRRAVTFILGLRDGGFASAAPVSAAPGNAREFWRLSQARSDRRARIANTAPFWQNQNALFVSVDPPPVAAESVVKPAESPDARTPSAPALRSTDAAVGKPEHPSATNDAPAPSTQDAWWLPAH